MIATMRRDWDETTTMPITDAHRRHAEIGGEAGYSGVGAGTLRENMEAVVERARRQRDGGPTD